MNEILIKNIKRIMKNKGIGSTYGFIKYGIAPQQIDGILKHGNPTVRTLEKLSIALEVDIIDFFKEEI